MPVSVRTFANSGEAAAALSTDRGARYLGGGTLVMRALNEGDVSISTVVRANDQALTRIDAAGPRVTIGAGTTFTRILAERYLAFLHAPARPIRRPAGRHKGHACGHLSAPRPDVHHTGAGGPPAGCPDDRRGGGGGRGGHFSRRQRARQRLVPARDSRRSPPTFVVRSGIGSTWPRPLCNFVIMAAMSQSLSTVAPISWSRCVK